FSWPVGRSGRSCPRRRPGPGRPICSRAVWTWRVVERLEVSLEFWMARLAHSQANGLQPGVGPELIEGYRRRREFHHRVESMEVGDALDGSYQVGGNDLESGLEECHNGRRLTPGLSAGLAFRLPFEHLLRLNHVPPLEEALPGAPAVSGLG